jgi:hypothetical protein
MPAVPHHSTRAPERRVPLWTARVSAALAARKFRLMSLFRTRLVAQSAAARFGTHHSRRLSCALSGGISTEPEFAWISPTGSVQYAIGHELCLYRSDAVRQGTVMLLLKILMEVTKKLITFLSHSEALVVLLLEVAECGTVADKASACHWAPAWALAANSSQQAPFRSRCAR